MGLDVSHDCFRGAYSAFMNFRCSLAGIALGREVNHKNLYGDMFGSEEPDNSIWEEMSVRWPFVTEHLLNHSDCDGDIPVSAQIGLAEELEKLAEMIPQTHMGSPHIERAGGTRAVALQFAAGLREANSNNEPVVFH